MEPKKMQSGSLSSDDNSSDHQTSSEASLASNVLSEDSPICPTSRIGSEYQAEIPDLATKDGRHELIIAGSLNSSTSQGYWYPMQQIGMEYIALWTDLEVQRFLLGLYIFGKNLNLLSLFVGTKTVGDILTYYYTKFYQRDAYKRWSDCRKAKTRKRILGERIFQGRRQKELLSRLKFKIPKETHDSVTKVFKSFSGSQTSLKEFVFSLKSIVGTEVFVEAVGLGKGKDDLTKLVTDQSKPNQALTSPNDMPTGKDWSSLGLEDIKKLLTVDSRRSKARSNDIFWEAVWPRLLGKGWHSEQPKDVRKAKNCIVFLVPGVKGFSRSELTKGTDYFDSVRDVLKKVAADPALLELEADGLDLATEKSAGDITAMELKRDSPLEAYQELPKFPIVDTSLVEGEEPFNVLEMRNLPADAKFSFVPTHPESNMVTSYSSCEEEDGTDRSSDGQEEGRGVAAEVMEIEMVTANGHSPSHGNGNQFDSADTDTEPERRKFLFPLSKRRRLTEKHNSGMNADDGAPYILNRNMNSEETGRPITVHQQPEPAALEVNPRRQGTRNRPLTAKALEAIAFGLFGTGKGKKGGDLKNMARNRPSQRARKTTKDQVPSASSSGVADSCEWNVKAIKGAKSMFK